MHILLIPDSFKDSISATAIVSQLEKGFAQVNPAITTESCIASDGGEGFLDFIKKYETVGMIPVKTVDPLGKGMVAKFAFAKASHTAYIELARASGIELLLHSERNPMYTSTYGTGIQIREAIKKGAAHIFVGLGGSATNDGGIGMAAALGYEFLDEMGKVLEPIGKNLTAISQIKKPEQPELPAIYAINDVDNPLAGKDGAAHIYGKQKGASPEDIRLLDKGLKNLASVVKKELGEDHLLTPGTGAAGGSGYGLKVFCNATFIGGVDFLARISGIEKRLENGKIDVIITGEGSIDHQTFRGKLVKGVASLGKKHNIPVIAICGINQLKKKETKDIGLQKVFAVSDLAESKEDSLENAAHYIQEIAYTIAGDAVIR